MRTRKEIVDNYPGYTDPLFKKVSRGGFMKVKIAGTLWCSECGEALFWLPPNGDYCTCINVECSFYKVTFECPTVELKRKEPEEPKKTDWIEFKDGQHPRIGETIVVRGVTSVYPYLVYVEGARQKLSRLNSSSTKVSSTDITHWKLIDSPF